MTASAAFDVVALTEASVLYALMLAEIHHLHPEDIVRPRLLVQTVLIGDSAITALSRGADRTVPYWGAQIVNKIPMSAVSRANKLLGPRFVTKYGTKQGILVPSKQVPLGLGIAVGAGANYLIGRTIVATAGGCSVRHQRPLRQTQIPTRSQTFSSRGFTDEDWSA